MTSAWRHDVVIDRRLIDAENDCIGRGDISSVIGVDADRQAEFTD